MFTERKTTIELRRVTRVGHEVEELILIQMDSERTLDDMLESFRCFLLSMGYNFKGCLTIIDEEEEERDRAIARDVCVECENTMRDLVRKELAEEQAQAVENWFEGRKEEICPR